MIRRGKLCRKCLNVVDATPANLIGTAFQMMGETANQEVSNTKVIKTLTLEKFAIFQALQREICALVLLSFMTNIEQSSKARWC